jgi:hypothetical protein
MCGCWRLSGCHLEAFGLRIYKTIEAKELKILKCLYFSKVHLLIVSKLHLEFENRRIHYFKGQCAFRGTSLIAMNLK